MYVIIIRVYIFNQDSIALRMKRNERRINQQSDGDDDENTSYEY